MREPTPGILGLDMRRALLTPNLSVSRMPTEVTLPFEVWVE